MGMIVIIFAQYGFSMGICLDLDVTGTAALNPLIVAQKTVSMFGHFGKIGLP
jgi:hypothetical protein